MNSPPPSPLPTQAVDHFPNGVDALIAAMPIVSGVIALLALVIAILGRRLAKRSLGVAERAEAKAEKQIDIYLETALQVGSGPLACIRMKVRVTNRSTQPVSVASAALRVEYEVDGAVISSEISASPTAPMPQFVAPSELKPRGIVSGWLEFATPPDRTGFAPILRQSLVLADTDGQLWLKEDIAAGTGHG